MDAMNFGAPEYFYGLLLVPLVGIFYGIGIFQRRKRLGLLQGPHIQTRWRLKKTMTTIKGLLLIVASLLIVLALSRPRWGFEWVEVQRRGIDMILAVDVSRSMLAQDISPSRLERTKRKIIDFLGLIGGDRVGLVAFAGTAFVQCPVTEDPGALRMFLDYLDPELIPFQGTDLKQAIAVSLKALEDGGQGAAKDRAIILLSDGEATESTDAEVDAAIALAKKAGVVIYTVGVGTEEGGPIPDATGSFKKDAQGAVIISRPDEKALARIAQETGGIFVRSVADDIDLRQIYFEGIKKNLQERDIKSSHDRNWYERYQWFTGLAFLILILELFVRDLAWGPGMIVFMVLMPAPRAQAFTLPDVLGKGHSAFEKGDYNKATDQFLRQETENPEDISAIYNRSVSQYRQGNFKDAAQGFAKSSAMTQDHELAKKSLFNAGNAYVGLGDLDKAIGAYEGVLQMDPQDKKAQENLDYVKNLKNQKKKNDEDRSKENDNRKDEKTDQDQKSQSDQLNQNEAQDKESAQSEETKNSPASEPKNPEPSPQGNSDSTNRQDPSDQRHGEAASNEKEKTQKPEEGSKQPEVSEQQKSPEDRKESGGGEPSSDSQEAAANRNKLEKSSEAPDQSRPQQGFTERQIDSILESVKDQASRYLLQPMDSQPPQTPKKDW